MKLARYAMFFVLTLSLPVLSHARQATQPSGTQTSPTHGSKKAESAPAATSQDIADAKAKGLVWVNTGTHVYHKDGASYGTTKHGKFMTEADAQKAGYRAAKSGGTSKKNSTATATK